MHERLIELWLDSANERAYQPAFVQLLVGEGHRILHSTRHGPLEFGKDVIAVAPDGVPCAYQLKGNPGGRLNRPQFREIQPQLQELVATAITYPQAAGVHHRSYLVTNGHIEEDVILLINQMNETWRRQGYGDQALRVLSRGDLLAMARAAGMGMWPFNLTGIEGVIAMLGHRGDAQLPLKRLHAILEDVYGLGTEAGSLGTAELGRRFPVAALLVSISLRNFAGRSNHFAILSAWVMFFTYTVAALELHGDTGGSEQSLSAARDAVFAALGSLAAEAVQREVFVEGQTWTDTELVAARTALVNALLAVHWMWDNERDGAAAGRTDVGTKLDGGLADGGLWGEGAVPHLLAHHWYLSARFGPEPAAARVSSMLGLVVSGQSGLGPSAPLPPPYYGADEVVLHRNHAVLTGIDDPIEGDDYPGHSFSAMGLLHLAVQAGAKDEVKLMWPHLTRLSHRSFLPALPWQFCMVRSHQGRDEEIVIPPRGEWPALLEAAHAASLPGVPARLAADPLLLLLFVIVCPHRMTPEVTRFLGLKLGSLPRAATRLTRSQGCGRRPRSTPASAARHGTTKK